MQHNDIIILGSDGLWDNLYDQRIVELVRPFIRDTEVLADPELVAEIIANEAEKYSYQQSYLSPFAKGAREHYSDYLGGKPDDITVIVGQVVLREARKL